MTLARLSLNLFLAVAALAGAATLAWWLLTTAPKTEPEDKKAAATIVQVIELQPRDERITVTAWGTVIPAREVVVRPQIEGRIIRHHPALVPGGRLADGDPLAVIDPADYQLALTEREAELAEARFEADVEEGRQIVARREWQQLKAELPEADVNPALALREPHLRKTEALLAKAENAIDKARLDLDRTTLVAPFNSMVTEESVEIGQLVQPGTDICRLVGTDAFWVQATLPVADLKWLRFPENDTPGSAANVHLDSGNGADAVWSGHVVRLLSDLETNGRMARVHVEVADPLGLEKNAAPVSAGAASDNGHAPIPLLLNSYVRVEIEAGRLQDVLVIPRAALREGNRLWVVDADDRLQIHQPEILWTRRATVLVPNVLRPGERLIVSELKSAPPGLAVDPQPLEAPAQTAAAPAATAAESP